QRLWPEHELVRQIKCVQGEIEVLLNFTPRLDYGRVSPKIKDCGKFGWRIDIGSSVFTLRSDVKLARHNGQGLSGKFRLTPKKTISFSLTFSTEAPAVIPPLGDLIEEKLNLTIAWWRNWAAQ